jgi:guanidinoacetate N-methyltransferase
MNLTKLLKRSRIPNMQTIDALRQPKLDTHKSRVNIGFLDDGAKWITEPAMYDEHTLRIAGHPVMEDWEQGYMETLARIATTNGGRVLELGYGMGLSAHAIQSHDIDSHYVIEANVDVATKALKDLRSPLDKNKVHVFTGLWEDVTPTLADGSFDGILFDTYPLTEEQIHSNHFWFFKEAYRLLKPGGVLTYYSDEVNSFSEQHIAKLVEAGFNPDKFTSEVCPVQPPEDCEYWQHDTILAPIIVK